jgi:SAM-dependent methyltransferase
MMTQNNTPIIRPPWDLDEPQPEIIRLMEDGYIQGPTLDVFCGTGENAVYISGFEIPALGIDTARPLLQIAREKAELMQVRRGLCARFRPGRPHRLTDLGETFQTILDLGLYQSLGNTEKNTYLQSLRGVLRGGGNLILIQFAADADGLLKRTEEARSRYGAAGWIVKMERGAEVLLRGAPAMPGHVQIYTI